MKKHLLIAGLFAASLLTACEKEAEKEDSASKFIEITAPFLTASDFEKGSEDQATTNEISSKLEEEKDLWDNYPENTSDSGSSSDGTSCMNNFKFKADGTGKVIIGGSDNLTACMQEALASTGVSFSNISVKFYQEIGCAGVDLSGLDGQTVSNENYATIEATCGSADVTTLMQSEMVMQGSMSFMGQVMTIDSNYKSAWMQADGTGCTEANSSGSMSIASCIDYSKAVSTSAEQTATDLTILEYQNVTKTEGSTDPFYTSGTIDIYLNGWDGTVTYNGATSNASYSVTSGPTTKTGTLTTSGTVTAASLKPVQNKLKNVKMNIRRMLMPKLH